MLVRILRARRRELAHGRREQKSSNPPADLKIQLPELLVRVEVLDNPFSIAHQSIKILYVILSEADRNAVCEVEFLRSE